MRYISSTQAQALGFILVFLSYYLIAFVWLMQVVDRPIVFNAHAILETTIVAISTVFISKYLIVEIT